MEANKGCRRLKVVSLALDYGMFGTALQTLLHELHSGAVS